MFKWFSNASYCFCPLLPTGHYSFYSFLVILIRLLKCNINSILFHTERATELKFILFLCGGQNAVRQLTNLIWKHIGCFILCIVKCDNKPCSLIKLIGFSNSLGGFSNSVGRLYNIVEGLYNSVGGLCNFAGRYYNFSGRLYNFAEVFCNIAGVFCKVV